MVRLGERISHYILKEKLGEGGSADVFLAVHQADPLTRVALKVLKHTGEETAARFEKERRFLARLKHPNIAGIFDFGITPGGRPWLAMDVVDGQPITRWCSQAKPTLRSRLRVFLTVCEAMNFAHRNFVIHRDLKPGNILVSENAVPTLLDFGIAAVLNPDSGFMDLATRQHEVLMTPEYASPEQVRGDSLTMASDVYALGVVLYEMLTGCRPYDFQDHRPGTIIKTVCQEEPLLPSRNMASVWADHFPARMLEGDLDNICLKALAKKENERYGSVEALSHDLVNYLEGRPVNARTRNWLYHSRKFIARHRGVMAIIVSSFLILSFFSMVMWRQQQLTAKERDRAEMERASAEHVTDFLVDLFRDRRVGSYGEPLTAHEMIQRGSKFLEEVKNPAVKARLQFSLGMMNSRIGDFDEARRLMEATLPYFEENGKRLVCFDIFQELMSSELELGNFEKALSWGKRGLEQVSLIEVTEQEQGKSQAGTFYNIMGRLYWRMGNREQARLYMNKALAAGKRVNDHAQVATAYNNLSLLWMDLGDYLKTEEYLTQAFQYWRGLGNVDPLVMMPSHHNMGVVAVNLGHFQKAETHFLQGLGFADQLGKDLPQRGHMLGGLADLYLAMGQPDKAEPYAREALALRRRTLGRDHELVAMSLAKLADVLTDRGDLESAANLYPEALKTLDSVLGPSHSRTLGVRSQAAFCYLLNRNFAVALRELEKLYTPAGASLKLSDVNRQRGLLVQAFLLKWQDRPDEAEALLKEAVSFWTENNKGQNDSLIRALCAMAGLLGEQGRYDEMSGYLEQLESIRQKYSLRLPVYEHAYDGLKGLYKVGTGHEEEGERLLRGSWDFISKSQTRPGVKQDMRTWLRIGFRRLGKEREAEQLLGS